MKNLILSSLAVAAIFSVGATAANASPKCTTEPQDKWLSEDVMKEKIAEMGYTNIKVFKKTMSGCYEIYGYTADGRKAEVYFNPVDGSVFEKNIDGEYTTTKSKPEEKEED
ncbi:MAG: PepSY domain-containing protein [Alphaproteobacteria bacterium]|nr:PepSY domain-containing protein [Alphaproteobacteria bacterium]